MRNRPAPSQTEGEILKFIKEFRDKHNYSPNLQEIADYRNRALPTVYAQVTSLISKGYITKKPNNSRSIQIVENEDMNVPQEEVRSSTNTYKEPENTIEIDDDIIRRQIAVNVALQDELSKVYKMISKNTADLVNHRRSGSDN